MAPAFSFPNPTYCATDLSLKVNTSAISVCSRHHPFHSTLPNQVYTPKDLKITQLKETKPR